MMTLTERRFKIFEEAFVKLPKCAFLVFLCIVGVFFIAGCGKKAATTPMKPRNDLPLSGSRGMELPMMKEDPRSIKSVKGVVREVQKNSLIVFTSKHVTLRFAWDKKTRIIPAGTVPVPGMRVKIEIDHIPAGMRAEEITVEPAFPAKS